ncbi:MAG TPA: ankyrin repeat domain-containing protein [Phycisphaerae bacterium]|nr:ankyrin repeat domain-containing protein [Phycisphaerae bacterium]
MGTSTAPVKTLFAAVERLPKTIEQDVTINVAVGRYEHTGGGGRDAQRLELNLPMREGARVRIVGRADDSNGRAAPGDVVLDWESDAAGYLVVVTQGHWTLENVQLGTRKNGQRHGISVAGPGLLELRDVRIHTGSQSGPGLRAHHGGRVRLYGAIELNEDLHESSGQGESFCRVEADYFGTIRFREGKGASLSVGNGNLSARYYGIIELGCEQARITSWNFQSNPIAVNNSGRVDLHNTTTRLCARNPRNTPIGLEHDGHVLAEGARIIIDGCDNSDAIVLQKASSFFCNDVEIRGSVRTALMAYSGSVLLAGIVGDLGCVRATTGSTIIIEKCTGRLIGPIEQDKGGQVMLPSGQTADDTGAAETESDSFGPLHRAARGGHLATVKQLISQGADVHAKGPNGWTPLHMAAIGGHRTLSEFLLSNGADMAARDARGRTAEQLAAEHGHNGLGAYLREQASKTK